MCALPALLPGLDFVQKTMPITHASIANNGPIMKITIGQMGCNRYEKHYGNSLYTHNIKDIVGQNIPVDNYNLV